MNLIHQTPPASRWNLWLVALFASSLACWSSALSAAEALPSFRLEGLRGGELSDPDVASGRYFLVVWASWSPRCREILERAHELAERQGARSQVVLVAFQEGRQEVERFLAGRKEPVPIYLDRDGSFARIFRIATLPGLVVIVDGEVRHQGRMPDDLAGLDSLSLEA